MPAIGLGTWLSKPGEVKKAVEVAVKAGYRHLDLAKIYGNHSEIGEALKELIPSVCKREELFLTSKLWNTAHKPELVEAAYDDTCKELGVDYLDLYLIHWPVSFNSPEPNKTLMPDDGTGHADLDLKTTLIDTWKAMIDLQKKGKVKVSRSPFSHLFSIRSDFLLLSQSLLELAITLNHTLKVSSRLLVLHQPSIKLKHTLYCLKLI